MIVGEGSTEALNNWHLAIGQLGPKHVDSQKRKQALCYKFHLGPVQKTVNLRTMWEEKAKFARAAHEGWRIESIRGNKFVRSSWGKMMGRHFPALITLLVGRPVGVRRCSNPVIPISAATDVPPTPCTRAAITTASRGLREKGIAGFFRGCVGGCGWVWARGKRGGRRLAGWLAQRAVRAMLRAQRPPERY